MASRVTDDVLARRVREVLESADLSTTTEKGIRKQLEKEFGVPLKEKKAVIRKVVEAFLADQQVGDEGGVKKEEVDGGDGLGDEDTRVPNGERVPSSSRKGGFGTVVLSEDLREFFAGAGFDTAEMGRTEVVKNLWAYIKENNLQNPSNRRQILPDDAMRRVFPKPFTMFQMSKLLTKHVFHTSANGQKQLDYEDEKPAARISAKKRKVLSPPSSPAPKRHLAASVKSNPDSAKSLGGFAKPLELSSDLSKFMGGAQTATRGEVTKRLYEYSKQMNLADPNDRRFILADETLKSLTGQSRFKAFGFQKLIKKHFIT